MYIDEIVLCAQTMYTILGSVRRIDEITSSLESQNLHITSHNFCISTPILKLDNEKPV